MRTDNVKNAGEPTVGQSGPPILNVSKQGDPTPDAPLRRQSHRDVNGRFATRPIPHRKPVLIDRSDSPVHTIGANGAAYPAFNPFQQFSDALAEEAGWRQIYNSLDRDAANRANVASAKERP